MRLSIKNNVEDKPPFPVVIIYAVDWASHDEQISLQHAKSLGLMGAWVVGMKIYEDEEKIIVIQEYFDREEQTRHTSVISKCSIKSIVEV